MTENAVGISPTTPELNNDTKTCYINEPGLYSLVLKSKLPSANKWLGSG